MMLEKMTHDVNVFLPMRAGSERVPRKNTRPIGGKKGGLCTIKLEQLLECRMINRIIVSTDDDEVAKISENFASEKIQIIDRPAQLASSSTSTDDLIKYVPDIMPNGHILWTHVTSPFITSSIYDHIIKTYLKNLPVYDSLMTVTKIQKFIWNDVQPVNYDRKIEKWPRTQTLDALWEVNSGVFLTSKEIYKSEWDRIGKSPFLYPLRDENAFDIDWLSDFSMAEVMYNLQKDEHTGA